MNELRALLYFDIMFRRKDIEVDLLRLRNKVKMRDIQSLCSIVLKWYYTTQEMLS